jgi:hypothetical protein
VHGVDQSDDIVLLDVDVANGRGEEIVFRWHSDNQNSSAKRAPGFRLCELEELVAGGGLGTQQIIRT